MNNVSDHKLVFIPTRNDDHRASFKFDKVTVNGASEVSSADRILSGIVGKRLTYERAGAR